MSMFARSAVYTANLRRFSTGIVARNAAASKKLESNGNSNGTAIMFMNMGGPSTVEETRQFLLNLFSDGELIPFGRFQKSAARFITARRTPMVEERYREIGGGSPIRKWSELQAKTVCERLDKIHPETAPHKPYVAFRYANPLTPDTYKKMLEDGVTRAVAFTQYPQFSYSTTGSSLNDLFRTSRDLDPDHKIQWSTIDRWPQHYSLVETFARHVKEALAKFPEDVRDQVVIQFSAHSLPRKVIDRGDSYTAEVAATTYAIMDKLNFCNPYRLTWQSKVGPMIWQGPVTSVITKKLLEDAKVPGVVIVPVAFTSDHIETLHEIDIELKDELKEPEKLVRCESLNGDPKFMESLADLVKDHLDSGKGFSNQLALDYKLGPKVDTFKSPSDFFKPQ